MFASIRTFLFIVVFFQSFLVAAQDDSDKIFIKFEQNAHPAKNDWKAYIQKNATLPDSLNVKMQKGTYPVCVKFVVDKYGNLGDIKAKNNSGFGIAEIAENIIRNYNGNWIPSNQCGRFVKSYVEETIVFKVN